MSPRSTQTELRNLLGCFLFSEDDVFKRIDVLSGGERSRYALLRMLLHPANFLLLDEPTNHLDLRAKDVLLNALEGYSGTVVFVSHDRYFIDKLATRVFEVADGAVHVFPGNYEDYRWRKENTSSAIPPSAARKGGAPIDTLDSQPSDAPKDGPKRLNPIKLKQMQERCAEVESEIEEMESRVRDLETALLTFVSVEETARLSRELKENRAALDQLLKEWEETSQMIAAQA